MDNPYILPLSLVTFLPALGALVLAFFPREMKGAMRWFTLAITVAVFFADGLVGHSPPGRRRYTAIQIGRFGHARFVFRAVDQIVQYLLFNGD